MKRDVLIWDNFLAAKETAEISYKEDDEPQEDSEEEEDLFTQGYEASPSEMGEVESTSSASDGKKESAKSDTDTQDDQEETDAESFVTDNLDAEDMEFEAWKCQKLFDILGISISTSMAFQENQIGIQAIKRFLNNCEDGCSWLLNDIIEGNLGVSQDIADEIAEEGRPGQLLQNLFDSLWFYYDWEEYDIEEGPPFLQKTYTAALNKLNSQNFEDVQKCLLQSIQELFTFNPNDFEAPFKEIREKYNTYATRQDWRNALIQWSFYTSYRKIFAKASQKGDLQLAEGEVLLKLASFHQETYLTKAIEDAVKRAKTYTKAYPHENTSKVTYKTPYHHQATLDIRQPLSLLKTVGHYFEPHRPRDKENVFVPQLYFIVSTASNQAEENDQPQFLEVSMQFGGLPQRPLTCALKDSVFNQETQKAYFTHTKKDVVFGKVLQGADQEIESQKIENLIKTKGQCGPRLIHSERVVMQALRAPEHVQEIGARFKKRLREQFGNGLYTVYGAVMLAYSTNTVCSNCTPTLLALQHSHEKGGFLHNLVKYLVSIKGSVTFKVKGYNATARKIDWSQFCLNTFVTADVDFDEEARDLAAEGQHSYQGRTNPPQQTHNPHAKLFFVEDTIDISTPALLEDHTNKGQRFFYEFVGKTTHTQIEGNNPYFQNEKEKRRSIFPGVVFSSGSTPWKNI